MTNYLFLIVMKLVILTVFTNWGQLLRVTSEFVGILTKFPNQNYRLDAWLANIRGVTVTYLLVLKSQQISKRSLR